MDGLNSFYDTDAGLDRLVRTESTAMIVDGPIHSFKEYHCQVHYKLTVCITRLTYNKYHIFSYKTLKNEQVVLPSTFHKYQNLL